MNFSNQENGANLAFSRVFHFYTISDYYKIRTRTNFKTPNGKSLDLHPTESLISCKLLLFFQNKARIIDSL